MEVPAVEANPDQEVHLQSGIEEVHTECVLKGLGVVDQELEVLLQKHQRYVVGCLLVCAGVICFPKLLRDERLPQHVVHEEPKHGRHEGQKLGHCGSFRIE